MATQNKLVWVAIGSGSRRWYETACKRFSLTRGRAAGTWTLYDRESKDAITPEFNRSETCYGLKNGKAKAERWAR